MDREKKRVIVVTGVTRGLGRAMTERLSSLGHTVLGCGRNSEVIAQLRNEFPKRHDFETVDVASDEQVQTWAARLHKRNGAPYLLVNNAGVINANAPLWKVSTEEFSKVIDVNVKGSVNVIRAFVPNMLRKREGIIVNFSSGWGRSAEKEVAPYCASKWAIEGLTQALALELPTGMAAVALNPGVINTDMLQSCFGESALHYPSAQRWAEKAVPFILKLDASDNGHALTVPE